MIDFNEAIQVVLENEGDTGQVTVDSGGLTKYGISQNAYPRLDIRHLTLEDAKRIYYEDYFKKVGIDEIEDQTIATKILDMVVNLGPNRAIKIVQKACGVECDGKLGPKTLAAINSIESHYLHNQLKQHQKNFYKNLVGKNPKKYRQYIAGWLSRADRC